MTTFTVPGVKGKGRPRFARYGAHVTTYTPDSTAEYEKAVQLAYQAAGGRLYDGAVAVRITAHQALPQRATKAQRAAAERGEIHPIRKPDLDNIVKIVLDALNGYAYRDDTQVLQLDARKIYTAGESHIIVTVGTLDEITPAPVDWAVG